MPRYLTLIKNLLFSLGLGFAVSLLVPNTGEVYTQLATPPLSPPGWVFGVVWSVLYAMLGFAAARVSQSQSPHKTTAYRIYLLHMLLNFAWTPIFFGAEQYLLALILLAVLLITAIAVMALFYKVDKPAGLLIIPYLFWLCFTFYLNLGVVVLN